MVDFFTKQSAGNTGGPATFKRYIMDHDIRHLAQDAGVSRITDKRSMDVLATDPYKELASDVRNKLFSLESLKSAMEELRDDHGKCCLYQLRQRAIDIQGKENVEEEILTGWELP